MPLKDLDAYIIFNETLKEQAGRENALIYSIVRFTNLPDRAARCSRERTIDSAQLHSAVNDLRRKSASPYVIEPRFDVPFKYELVDKLEEGGGNRAAPKSPPKYLKDLLEIQGSVTRILNGPP